MSLILSNISSQLEYISLPVCVRKEIINRISPYRTYRWDLTPRVGNVCACQTYVKSRPLFPETLLVYYSIVEEQIFLFRRADRFSRSRFRGPREKVCATRNEREREKNDECCEPMEKPHWSSRTSLHAGQLHLWMPVDMSVCVYRLWHQARCFFFFFSLLSPSFRLWISDLFGSDFSLMTVSSLCVRYSSLMFNIKVHCN